MSIPSSDALQGLPQHEGDRVPYHIQGAVDRRRVRELALHDRKAHDGVGQDAILGKIGCKVVVHPRLEDVDNSKLDGHEPVALEARHFVVRTAVGRRLLEAVDEQVQQLPWQAKRPEREQKRRFELGVGALASCQPFHELG